MSPSPRKYLVVCVAALSLSLSLSLGFSTLVGPAFLGFGKDREMGMMRRGTTQAILLAASVASIASGQQRQQPNVLDLSTVDWTLTSPNFSNISVPGKVPSQVHLDLRAAEVYLTIYPQLKIHLNVHRTDFFAGYRRSIVRPERIQSSLGGVFELDIYICAT